MATSVDCNLLHEENGFQYRIVTPEYYDAVIQFMWGAFFNSAPISVALNYTGSEPKSDVNDAVLENLKYGLSVMAIDKQSETIAAIMTVEIECVNDSIIDLSKLRNQALIKTNKIASDLTLLELNLFETYQVDKFLYFGYLAVSRNYKGRGLGNKVVQVALDNVKTNDEFKFATVFCSAKGSQSIFRSHGFSVLNEGKLTDYPLSDWSNPEFIKLNENSFQYMIKHL